MQMLLGFVSLPTYGIVKTSLHSLLLTYSAEEYIAATQTFKGGSCCYLSMLIRLRPRPHRADFLVKPHKSLCVSADRPDGAGESGALNHTFLKPPSEGVSNLSGPMRFRVRIRVDP